MHDERSVQVATRDKTRGFTLIELLIAVVAGLLVAAAAISFSKQSTRMFSQEARIAAAQMSVLAGFQRLQSDVARASYMATPNMHNDMSLGRVCNPPVPWAGGSAPLNDLSGLLVAVGGSTMPDGETPDSIRIAGSLSSNETFPVRTVLPSGSGHDVYLQLNTGAMARSGFQNGADLTSVFQPGRILRLVTEQRKQVYEVISSATWVDSRPVIKTVGPLPLQGEGFPCGIAGYGIGAQANVVDLVEYSIANVKDHPIYKNTVYSDAGYALGDEYRTELIRREIRLAGDVQDGEIVAEYAVDLRVGLWVANAGGGVAYVPPSSTSITDDWMNLDTPPSGPQSVRAVELRLVVRSREVDRGANTDQTDPVLDGGFMFRYPVPGPNDGGTGFARARTLLADVTLHNQGGDAW